MDVHGDIQGAVNAACGLNECDGVGLAVSELVVWPRLQQAAVIESRVPKQGDLTLDRLVGHDGLQLGRSEVWVGLNHQSGNAGHEGGCHAGAGLAGIAVLGGSVGRHNAGADGGDVRFDAEVRGVPATAVDGEAEVLVQTRHRNRQARVAGAVNGIAADEGSASELVASREGGDDASLDHHVHLSAPGGVSVVVDVDLELLLSQGRGNDVNAVLVPVVYGPLGALYDVLYVAVAAGEDVDQIGSGSGPDVAQAGIGVGLAAAGACGDARDVGPVGAGVVGGRRVLLLVGEYGIVERDDLRVAVPRYRPRVRVEWVWRVV